MVCSHARSGSTLVLRGAMETAIARQSHSTRSIHAAMESSSTSTVSGDRASLRSSVLFAIVVADLYERTVCPMSVDMLQADSHALGFFHRRIEEQVH